MFDVLKPKDKDSAHKGSTIGDSHPRRKNVLELSMVEVSAYTATTVDPTVDYDIVHWSSTSDDTTIHNAIKNFIIYATYEFWVNVTKNEAKNLTVTTSDHELVCSFKLVIIN